MQAFHVSSLVLYCVFTFLVVLFSLIPLISLFISINVALTDMNCNLVPFV